MKNENVIRKISYGAMVVFILVILMVSCGKSEAATQNSQESIEALHGISGCGIVRFCCY